MQDERAAPPRGWECEIEAAGGPRENSSSGRSSPHIYQRNRRKLGRKTARSADLGADPEPVFNPVKVERDVLDPVVWKRVVCAHLVPENVRRARGQEGAGVVSADNTTPHAEACAG